MNFLNQATLVTQLLNLVEEALPKIDDDVLRVKITNCLALFEESITPSTIYLDEVFQKAHFARIELSKETAMGILNNAAEDIDLNYVNGAIQYHFDEYVSKVDS